MNQGMEAPGRAPGVIYSADLSRNVVEPARKGRNGLATLYCMVPCPLCHVRCGQRRGAWSQNGRGQWAEERKCSKCGKVYPVLLLPFEIKEAQVIFADPDFGKDEIG